MNKAPLLSSLLATSLLLSGCSGTLLETKKIDYKTASKLPTLEVPPDLTTPARDDRYALPEAVNDTATYSGFATAAGQGQAVSARQTVLPQVQQVKLERDGNQRWLVVQDTPERLWPRLREFWQAVGFGLASDMPEAGVMETEWNENRAKLPLDFIRRTLGKALDSLYSTSELDKFRTRLEKGTAPGTTEIYISHRGMMEVYSDEGKAETRWQPRPADPELEAEMLQRLMVSLGVDKARSQAMLAEATPQSQRAQLTQSDGRNVLLLNESFERAWRRIGLALDRVDFTVEDRDRSQGIYYVRYADPEAAPHQANAKEGKSWLGWLKFWQQDKEAVKQASAPLRIQVKDLGNGSQVEVLSAEGGNDHGVTARKIVKLLYEQLK